MKKIIFAILLGSILAKADTFNFRISPIHTVIGFLNINLDIAVSSNWTLGPTYGYWTYSSKTLENNTTPTNYNVKYMNFGLRGNWFANGTYKDGFFAGPYLNFVNASVAGLSGSVVGLSGKATANNLGCLVGYGWFWTTFNQMLSGGVSTTLGDSKVKVVDSGGTTVDEVSGSNFTGFAVEYTMGWTF